MIDGTMPGMEIRALPRLLAAAVFAAFAAMLTVGCSGSVPSEPAPRTPPPVTVPPPLGLSAPPSAEPPPVQAATCQMTATSTSISASGSGFGTYVDNGGVSFTCGDGPQVGIETIADAGVTFAAPDGTTTTVAPGTPGRVGGYTIDVARVAGDTAEFQVLLE